MSRVTRGVQLLDSIGFAISKRRAELGLSQEELALAARVHRTYVSDLERGTRNVSVLTLDRIANALDLPLEVLLIVGNASGVSSAKSKKK